MEDDMTVYHAMLGNEFHVDGTLRDWDLTGRLHQLDVPTLIVTGAFDEVVPSLAEEMHQRIAGSEFHLFEAGSHLTHLEQPDRFIELVTAFLDRHDPEGER